MPPVRSTRSLQGRSLQARPLQARQPPKARADLLSLPPQAPAAPARPSQRRGIVLAIVLACCVVLIGVAGIAGTAGYRAWTSHATDTALAELQQSNEQRIALRYGDLRIPIRDNVCTSYAFDNATGWLVDQREIACHVASEDSPPGWEHSGGTIARAHGMANGFKH